jgi:hypothetical protein
VAFADRGQRRHQAVQHAHHHDPVRVAMGQRSGDARRRLFTTLNARGSSRTIS